MALFSMKDIGMSVAMQFSACFLRFFLFKKVYLEHIVSLLDLLSTVYFLRGYDLFNTKKALLKSIYE